MPERRRSGTAKISTLTTSAIADVAPVEERLTLLAQPRLTGRLKKGKSMHDDEPPAALRWLTPFPSLDRLGYS